MNNKITDMKWIEVKIITSDEASEAIVEKLTILGAYGISIENPFEIANVIKEENSLIYADEGFIDSLGEDVTISAYFAQIGDEICLGVKDEENDAFIPTDHLYYLTKDQRVEYDVFLQHIKAIVNDVGEFLDVKKGEITTKYIDDEDWANSWKKYYKPLKISPRVVVVPSWENYEPKDNEKILILDPKSAFGTGSHETTRMCAELIDEFLQKNSSDDLEILDLGCGSGILAITAAKLGALNITAVDIDEVAVKVANDNASANNVDDKITCFNAQAKDLPEKEYDVIIANIIADVLFDIALDIKRIIKPGGTFITGGIIKTKEDMVINRYLQEGFVLEEKKTDNDWVSIKFKKISS